ncbi:hypothetical protein SAMN02799631_06529 [Methylobacterium sp. 174MFSha1.1]|uniref:hypothetical protein n=1 Tax=Methylobacterium sp. 174MFSha1.1 TaxID=1502749 RepID=UPI0008EE4AF9|nr:hypothetical protein [Methylobacterium sp. 174MFSha1.1]SFV16810.1 hypothetical protein SAMN02799631_06529 [Methylobacterium sp. 174MFSha1.1]
MPRSAASAAAARIGRPIPGPAQIGGPRPGLQDDARAGRASEGDLIHDAGVLLGAALSAPYRHMKETRDVVSH